MYAISGVPYCRRAATEAECFGRAYGERDVIRSVREQKRFIECGLARNDDPREDGNDSEHYQELDDGYAAIMANGFHWMK